jgi:hypothetical protein
MLYFIKLTAVDTRKETAFIRAQQQADNSNFRNVQLDEDDLEQPITDPDEADEAPAAATPGLEPEGLYFPVTVFLNEVREFHVRKGGKTGTRIVSPNGAARIVKETYAEVQAKVEEALDFT